MEKNREDTEIIRELFSYAHLFKNKLFIFKIDYQVMMQRGFPVLIKDLALLHQAGIKIIIVPGAKERIDEVLQTYGFPLQYHQGIRITTEEAIPFVKMAAFDVSTGFMSGLAAEGVHAVVGNWVKAKSLGVVDGIDYHNSGIVERISGEPLFKALHQGFVPIFPCIGWNDLGKPYNLSSDQLSVEISAFLQAEKLLFITCTRELTTDSVVCPESAGITGQGRVSRLDVAGAECLLTLNKEKEQKGELSHIKMAIQACKQGVNRVHIVQGSIEGVILQEIFSNLGSGTMVHTNEYEKIRKMKPEDIPDVLRLVEPYVQQGTLVPRDKKTFEQQFQYFVVYDVDGTIHGCAALFPYLDSIGEIAAVAVDQSYSRMGIGKKMVSYLLVQGKSLGLKKIFALTTKTSDWFEKQGFYASDLSIIPPNRRKQYNFTRNSKIMGFNYPH